MFGKLINEELVLAPVKKLEYMVGNKRKLVINPKEKHYYEAGYKPVEYDDMPEDTEAYTIKYGETAKKIKVSYVAVEETENE